MKARRKIMATNSMGIRKYDHIEFYVGSAKMVAYWFCKNLAMKVVAYKGPETGHRDRASFYMESGGVKIVVTSALHPNTSDVLSFLALHGDGVKRYALEVDSVEESFQFAVSRGAIPVAAPERMEGHDKEGKKTGQGYMDRAALKIYDDTEIVLLNRDHYRGIFEPGFGEPIQKINIECEDPKLKAVDHIVGNVRINEMNMWAEYYNKTFEFETFVDFGPGDIGTQYSALLSKVVRSKDNVVKNPINEPYKGLRQSQIEEYLKNYYGSGVQHIAISTHSICTAIRALRKNGVEFLQIPDTYYDEVRRKNAELKKAGKLFIQEDIAELQELGILVDFEGDGYLLQLFTRPIFDRPTFFFEFIQRVGKSEGFGKGNFQSLFEAIELDQDKRGNLK
jgi:4-hydroxyphenylpyruvate dioxygenase